MKMNDGEEDGRKDFCKKKRKKRKKVYWRYMRWSVIYLSIDKGKKIRVFKCLNTDPGRDADELVLFPRRSFGGCSAEETPLRGKVRR